MVIARHLPLARTWVTRRRGEGYVLVHRDWGGYVFVVNPTDEANGDTLEAVRFYIATNAMPGDLYYEDGRLTSDN